MHLPLLTLLLPPCTPFRLCAIIDTSLLACLPCTAFPCVYLWSVLSQWFLTLLLIAVEDWDAFEQLLQFGFTSSLQCNPSEKCIMMSQPTVGLGAHAPVQSPVSRFQSPFPVSSLHFQSPISSLRSLVLGRLTGRCILQWATRSQTEKLSELLFEKFNVKALHFVKSPVLSW